MVVLSATGSVVRFISRVAPGYLSDTRKRERRTRGCHRSISQTSKDLLGRSTQTERLHVSAAAWGRVTVLVRSLEVRDDDAGARRMPRSDEKCVAGTHNGAHAPPSASGRLPTAVRAFTCRIQCPNTVVRPLGALLAHKPSPLPFVCPCPRNGKLHL